MDPEDEVTPEPETPEVPDTAAFEAKIGELTAALVEKDSALAAAAAALDAAKAHNYDLLMQLGTPVETVADEADDDDFDIDDLFGEDN